KQARACRRWCPVISAERLASRIPTPDDLEARHVLAAAHQVLAEGIAPKDGTVLERARRIAKAETPEAREGWQLIRSELALPSETVESWLSPLVVAASESVLALAFVDPSVASWSARRFGRLLDEAARRLTAFRSVEFRALGGGPA